MTGTDLPDSVKDRHRGERIYIPKGWASTAERDRLIRRCHRENVAAHMPRMVSIARLASQFGLSEKRIQAIIYS